jgi:hypothetical protein
MKPRPRKLTKKEQQDLPISLDEFRFDSDKYVPPHDLKLTKDQEETFIASVEQGFQKLAKSRPRFEHMKNFKLQDQEGRGLIYSTNLLINGLPEIPYPAIRAHNKAMAEVLKMAHKLLSAMSPTNDISLGLDESLTIHPEVIRELRESLRRLIRHFEYEIVNPSQDPGTRHPITLPRRRGKRATTIEHYAFNEWLRVMARWFYSATCKRKAQSGPNGEAVYDFMQPGKGKRPFSEWVEFVIKKNDLPIPTGKALVARIKHEMANIYPS